MGMERIGVLTSGGDSPGMNAAVRAVVRTAEHYKMKAVGIKRGYNGTLLQSKDRNDDYEELSRRKVGEIIHRGGTLLMTARCKEFLEPANHIKAVDNMRSVMKLDGLVVIGGDGTFRGLNDLHNLHFPVVGIPGTIDNDLPFTDMTLGFDTALNTVCDSVNRIRETMYSHERGSVVEVMGRDCGDIALFSGLACGAEIVLLPDKPWDVDEVAQRMKNSADLGKKNPLIVIAEGAWASMKPVDMKAFCVKHGIKPIKAEGEMSSEKLALLVEKKSGIETRATVLGYIQRGGSPSAADRILACRMGERAVELLRGGPEGFGHVVGIHKNKLIDRPVASAISRKPREGRTKMNEHLLEMIKVLAI